ncbi:MAG: hypothetical protein DCC75_12845, partial [Proteobacteria bacterium]
MLLEVLFSPYLRYVLIALCAGAVAQIITPIVANIASDCGILDYPGDRRLSTRIIPRAGGVSVFLSGAVGLILAALVSLHFGLEGGISPVWIRKFLLCASILLIVGLLDDKRGLNWTTKLAWQLAVSFLLFSLGTSVGSIAGQALPFWLDAAL